MFQNNLCYLHKIAICSVISYVFFNKNSKILFRCIIFLSL